MRPFLACLIAFFLIGTAPGCSTAPASPAATSVSLPASQPPAIQQKRHINGVGSINACQLIHCHQLDQTQGFAIATWGQNPPGGTQSFTGSVSLSDGSVANLQITLTPQFGVGP